MFFHLKSALGAFQTPGSLGPFWLSCRHLSGSSLVPTDHKMESLQFCPAPSFLSSAVVSFLLLFGVPPKATSGPCVWPHSCFPSNGCFSVQAISGLHLQPDRPATHPLSSSQDEGLWGAVFLVMAPRSSLPSLGNTERSPQLPCAPTLPTGGRPQSIASPSLLDFSDRTPV